MSRLKHVFNFFKRDGIKFLLLELIVVFLGVYLAFVFQNYSANKQIKTEQEKVLIGLKEDLEYFRFFFPGYAVNAKKLVRDWNEVHAQNSYIDFSDWRFLQPQYDYTAVEYALDADADVINFELNSAVAEVYQELEKLRHVETLMTELAMTYTVVPPDLRSQPTGKLASANNLLNFRRFIDRANDRAEILERVADLCSVVLPKINDRFSSKKLTEVELAIVTNQVQIMNPQQLDSYLPMIMEFFPNLTEEEIRAAYED